MPRGRCDLCGAEGAKRVVYGDPGEDLIESAGRGEIVLGGCLIGGRDPSWLCEGCAGARDPWDGVRDGVEPGGRARVARRRPDDA
ncbi:MAG: hypothetical protein KC560_15855 [Myxococcales bacterium]|nr:hypothetical protein [Myxococcales bacterium]